MPATQAELDDIADRKKRYIEYYKENPIRRYAAMYVGRNEDTILRWEKEDAVFAEAVKQAQADRVKNLVRRSKPEFILERTERDNFGPVQRIQHEITTPTTEAQDLIDKALGTNDNAEPVQPDPSGGEEATA